MAARFLIALVLAVGVHEISGLTASKTAFKVVGKKVATVPGQPPSPPQMHFVDTDITKTFNALTMTFWIRIDAGQSCFDRDVVGDMLRIDTFAGMEFPQPEGQNAPPPLTELNLDATLMMLRMGPKKVIFVLDENYGKSATHVVLDTPAELLTPPGTWRHVALTWAAQAGGQASMYIDGSPVVGYTQYLPLQFHENFVASPADPGAVSLAFTTSTCDFMLDFTDLQVFNSVLQPSQIFAMAKSCQKMEGDVVSYENNKFTLFSNTVKTGTPAPGHPCHAAQEQARRRRRRSL